MLYDLAVFINFFSEETVDPFMQAFEGKQLHNKSQKLTKCVRAKLKGGMIREI